MLVHRRTEFRASALHRRALAQSPNITVLTPRVVTEILGDEEAGVTGIRVVDLANDTPTEIAVDGVFIAIGHQPASQLFTHWLEVDQTGFLVTAPDATATNVPGVFAAGDIADPRYRQAVTAAASGCEAALDAERWLIARRCEGMDTVDRVDTELSARVLVRDAVGR